MTEAISTNRRTLLKGGAALLAVPFLARSAAGQASHVRVSMTSEEGVAHLQTYRKAVAAMWALDPSDPHNWFRYAMIHLMDCPHGNWWFFVWHRPYVAHLERIVRIYGEDEAFAMPYWDWTADPFVADTFFASSTYPDNALDPSSSHYPDWDSFESAYHDPIEAFWTGLSDAQKQQETLRGFPDFDSFWTTGVQPNFNANPADGRSKTAAAPDLTPPASDAVMLSVIEAGLRPELFTTVVGTGQARTGFNSPESQNHHQGVGAAILEGQPHNKVHNDLGSAAGGWMPSLLSSVDPIFFMHHCNVDRLWDVWTKKERTAGRTALPTAEEAPRFDPEPFLFYIGDAGQPAPSTAGASMDIAPWGYAYTPGSGSASAAGLQSRRGTAPNAIARADEAFGLNEGATASLSLPEAAATAGPDETRQVAQVTFTPPRMLKGLSFDVFVSPGGETPELSEDSPGFAGSFEFFGMLKGHGHDFTAVIDVTDAVARLREAGKLQADGSIDVTLAASGTGMEDQTLEAAPLQGVLKSVVFESF
ncbi:tyrosinase family protein [Rhodovulum visakhapatnamense]|uniref:Common central domain of tyrosinase n=1 Tax=Rhodovulum visakhapatnamense TaxID=364297 RepID=A0A4R8G083_9RHOB|nr:tyrosinase family protein [Rhodovulum visakhapatnamense]TDX31379.1 common central domain of tyrosinase [Rhodovulum visakhapatnamense]